MSTLAGTRVGPSSCSLAPAATLSSPTSDALLGQVARHARCADSSLDPDEWLPVSAEAGGPPGGGRAAPLAGLTVLEIAAPATVPGGRTLAELGAEVASWFARRAVCDLTGAFAGTVVPWERLSGVASNALVSTPGCFLSTVADKEKGYHRAARGGARADRLGEVSEVSEARQ